MASLTNLFDLSRGSLVADQAALAVVGNNIANQNVAGYTQQSVNWQSGDTVTISSGGQQAVTAPTATGVSVRSLPLEHQVQQQTQLQSATSAESDVLSQLESVFSITGTSATAGSTQLGTAINGLFSSFTSLASNPGDTPTRQAVLSAASSVAGAFNGAATQVAQVAATVTSDIGGAVTQVNALTATIANLNQQIQTNSATAASNADAGALEDQRQAAIAQLSQYVGLDQVRTEKNGISLTTTGGATLVSGQSAFALTTVSTTTGIAIKDSAGQDVTGTISGGSIGGQLTALSVDVPAVTSALDSLAFRVATAVNTQNAAGVDLNGNPGGPIFTIPATAPGASAAITVVATNPSAIAAAASGEGTAGNTNANALAALQKATSAGGSTITGDLGTLVSQLGSSAATLANQTTNQQTALTAVKSLRDSYSAVSLNQEAADLSTYQQSYEASAKLFSILNTLMAGAINLGSATTV
jgi:flagellar hook-associated protein 1 FlgK